MKFDYNDNDLAMISHLIAYLPEKVVPRDDESISDYQLRRLNYYGRQLIEKRFRLDERAKEFERAVKDKYPQASWINLNFELTPLTCDATADFTVNFKSREAMLGWAVDYDVEVPEKCRKEGQVNDNVITTKITHTVKLEHDVTAKLSYMRDGAPTSKCRIDTQTYTQIVCDIV